MSGRRTPGGPALFAATLVAALVVAWMIAGCAIDAAAQEPSDDDGRHQGRTAEWWAQRTTLWKRRAQRRNHTIHTLKTMSRRRWTPTLEHGIQLAAITYRQPASSLYRVAWCESKLFLYARSNGGHVGPYQFLPSTWRSTPYARFSPYDPIAAPLAAAWMWHRGRKGEWSCA